MDGPLLSRTDCEIRHRAGEMLHGSGRAPPGAPQGRSIWASERERIGAPGSRVNGLLKNVADRVNAYYATASDELAEALRAEPGAKGEEQLGGRGRVDERVVRRVGRQAELLARGEEVQLGIPRGVPEKALRVGPPVEQADGVDDGRRGPGAARGPKGGREEPDVDGGVVDEEDVSGEAPGDLGKDVGELRRVARVERTEVVGAERADGRGALLAADGRARSRPRRAVRRRFARGPCRPRGWRRAEGRGPRSRGRAPRRRPP